MKEYRSAIRSRNMIKRAFFELLSQKNVTEITVVDIVSTADISRNTFYAHYDDIYSVLNEIENDFIDKLNIYVGENCDLVTDNYSSYLFQKIARFIEADAESSGIFIIDPDFDKFSEKIKDVIKSRIITAYKIEIKPNFEITALLECVASGFISLCRKSLKCEIAATIDEISKEVAQIFDNCLQNQITNASV